jgi:hypothetical protein
MHLAREFPRVALCDLDIVNPYFRTADHARILAQANVQLVSSAFANTAVEMPWAPVEVRAAFDDPNLRAVIDLGGDERGALAIGRYATKLAERDDVQMWMAVNPYRPLSRNVEDLLGYVQEIERAARLKFTGLVCNPNIGAQTSENTVREGYAVVQQLSEALGLPIVMTAVMQGLAVDVPGKKFAITRHESRFDGSY